MHVRWTNAGRRCRAILPWLLAFAGCITPSRPVPYQPFQPYWAPVPYQGPAAQPPPGSVAPPPDVVRPAPEADAPQLERQPAVELAASGPGEAAVGSTITVRFELSNRGNRTAAGVVVTLPVPPQATFVGSVPQATLAANQARWRLGDLPAGQSRVIDVNLRCQRAGMLEACATAQAAEGPASRDCAQVNVTAGEAIEVRMTGAETATVGEEATFAIRVTNRGGRMLTGLLLRNEFDDGLVHEAAESPIEKDLADLAPGATEEVGVTFRVTRAGRLCTGVEVLAQEELLGSAEACLTARPPAAGPRLDADARPEVSVEMTGPESEFVGGVAEFRVKVTNTGDVPLTQVAVVTEFDAGLTLFQASPGHEREGETSIRWPYDSLDPGQSLALRVQCRCAKLAESLCGRVQVTTAEKAKDESEACLRVRAAPSELALSVRDVRDPIAVGKDAFYTIEVTNKGETPDRQVVVSFTVPEGLELVPLGTVGPGAIRRYEDVGGGTYRFMPVAEVAPGEKLTYRVHLRADRAVEGEAPFKVTVDSEGLERPVEAEEGTRIVP